MQEILKKRTMLIGVKIIELINILPNKPAVWAISNQIVRSSTSIGANYRAACRAKSMADFIYKIKIVEEETDETIYWIEILIESKFIEKENVKYLIQELNEILSIIVSSIKTARRNLEK